MGSPFAKQVQSQAAIGLPSAVSTTPIAHLAAGSPSHSNSQVGESFKQAVLNVVNSVMVSPNGKIVDLHLLPAPTEFNFIESSYGSDGSLAIAYRALLDASWQRIELKFNINLSKNQSNTHGATLYSVSHH